MNSCNFVGTLGKDWDMQQTGSGTDIAKCSMAIKKYDKTTTWINLVCFGKQCEILSKYTKKGDQLGIQTEVDINEHDGKYYTSFIISKFTFIGSKNQGYGSQGFQNNQQSGFQGGQ